MVSSCPGNQNKWSGQFEKYYSNQGKFRDFWGPSRNYQVSFMLYCIQTVYPLGDWFSIWKYVLIIILKFGNSRRENSHFVLMKSWKLLQAGQVLVPVPFNLILFELSAMDEWLFIQLYFLDWFIWSMFILSTNLHWCGLH